VSSGWILIVLKCLYQKIIKPKRVLFYRDFVSYYGGHQKIADYVTHLESSFSYKPDISFSAQTHWDASNPWYPTYKEKSVPYNPANYDFIFLAGTDWKQYLPFATANKPVINLIQHVRHADPESDVYEFLSQRAVRICVSHQVAEAISATGRVNGPIYTIPNGVDLPLLATEKVYDLIILGIKQPEIARTIQQQLVLYGLRLLVVDQWVPREEWLNLLATSHIALLLPNFTEGFYLPALEAMKYCSLVIVPDCIGNREFCKDNQNCLMPEYDIHSMLACIDRCLHLLKSEQVLTVFRQEMNKTLNIYTLANERRAFLGIMRDVEKLWMASSA